MFFTANYNFCSLSLSTMVEYGINWTFVMLWTGLYSTYYEISIKGESIRKFPVDKNLVTEYFKPYHILFYTFQRLYNVVIRFFSSDFIGIEKTQVKLSCVRFHSQVFVTLLKFVFSGSHKSLIFKVISYKLLH